MKLQYYIDLLSVLLKQDIGCVVLLKGEWGIGKTFFWDLFSSEKLRDTPHAYVSLFGKKNIDQIKNDALIQIFSRNKHVDWASGVLNQLKGAFKTDEDGFDLNLGISGNVLSLGLSLLKKNQLINNIICIDDFERKSADLKVIEVMGFTSILAERYGCKIILIMDEEKIDERDFYNQYKEKLITHEIEFTPDHSELVENITKSARDRYRQGIIDAISFMNERNLRTIKKIVNNLVSLVDITGESFNDDFAYVLSFRFSILVIVYCTLGSDGLSEISYKFSEDEEPLRDSDYPARKQAIATCKSKVMGRVSNYSEFDNLLWRFIQSYLIDKDGFNEHARHSEANKAYELAKNEIYDLFDAYTFDVKFQADVYKHRLVDLFTKNKDNLIEIISLDSFLYLLSSIEPIESNPGEAADLKKLIFTTYINNTIDKVSSFDLIRSLTDNNTVHAIIESDDSLRALYNEKLQELMRTMVTKENTMEIMESIRVNSGWNPEDESYLNSLQPEFIRHHLESDPDFFMSIIDFFKWRGASISSFLEFRTNTRAAIDSIGIDKIGSFRYNRIISIFK